MEVGDIVFGKCRYSNTPIMSAGPVLITKVYDNDRHIDICYLNNQHTNKPQGLGHAYKEHFMTMEQVPSAWCTLLHFWVTRAICSDDPNLAMTYEAGQAVQSELKRLEVYDVG